MIDRWIIVLIRCFFSFVLGLITLIPAWITLGIIVQIVTDPQNLGWDGVLLLVVNIIFLYFLLPLIYRTFTGRHSEKTNSFLPRWAVRFLIHSFGVFAIFGISLAIYESNYLLVPLGVGYLLVAHFALLDLSKVDNSGDDSSN